MKKIEFFWDVGSPYTYLAFTQLSKISAATNLAVELRPFLLGGVFRSTGNSMPAQVPAKAMYMVKDLERWAKHYKVPICSFNEVAFPINTLLPMRVATAALHSEIGNRFAERVLSAYWAEGKNVSELAVVSELIGDLHEDPAALLAQAQEQTIKDELRATTDEAVARGAFGAPSIFVDEELFWGNDRLQLLESIYGS